MRFSVVIPTYNRAEKLRLCLNGFAQQTFSDYEVIVVDDGSIDHTRDVAERYGFVKYVRREHSGTATLLNAGWRESAGEFILMTDDDCVGPSNWLMNLADGFARYPDVVAAGSYAAPPVGLPESNRFARFDEWELHSLKSLNREYIGGPETPTAGLVAYRRWALEEVGGFRENLMMAGAHDHDVKQRLTSLGYQYLFLPLKIDHHRDYDASSFRRQHMGRGRAFIRYQISTGKENPSRLRVLGRLLKKTASFPKDLVKTRDLTLAFTIFQSGIYHCVGQWKELSHQQS